MMLWGKGGWSWGRSGTGAGGRRGVLEVPKEGRGVRAGAGFEVIEQQRLWHLHDMQPMS